MYVCTLHNIKKYIIIIIINIKNYVFKPLHNIMYLKVIINITFFLQRIIYIFIYIYILFI